MDPASQADFWNNMIGPTQGPNGPTSWLLSLWDGDPDIGGVEASAADCPGYARVSIAKADWAEATEANPVKETIELVQFPEATGEWGRTMTHWALIHPTTGALGLAFQIAKDQQLDITAAGDGPTVRPTAFFYEATQEA